MVVVVERLVERLVVVVVVAGPYRNTTQTCFTQTFRYRDSRDSRDSPFNFTCDRRTAMLCVPARRAPGSPAG